jgi:hypothetical protein
MAREFKSGDDCPFCDGILYEENGLKCSNNCHFDKVKWERVKEDEKE